MQKVQRVIDKRRGKFNFELAREKTKGIKFTRFKTEKSETFVYLGFEYRWVLSRKGKPLLRMKTARKKLQLTLSVMQSWIKTNRSEGLTALKEQLRGKLSGHYNYYGVSGNALTGEGLSSS